MCWIGHAEKAKRVSNGKTVYKIVRNDLTSEYMRYQYKYGVKTPRVMIRPEEDDGLSEISNGYHSYPSLVCAAWIQTPNTKVVKCTIPAGTIYYDKDMYGTLVSEQLIVDRAVPQFIASAAWRLDSIVNKWVILTVIVMVSILLLV